MASEKLKAAIIGSGNIGTDLMIKILRHGRHLEIAAMVGIDANSDGLARAARLGVATTHEGVEGLTRLPVFDQIDFVFDATSAGAHVRNAALLRTLAVDSHDRSGHPPRSARTACRSSTSTRTSTRRT